MYTALCGIALLKVMSDFLILKGRNYIEITNSKIRVSQSFKNKGGRSVSPEEPGEAQGEGGGCVFVLRLAVPIGTEGAGKGRCGQRE